MRRYHRILVPGIPEGNPNFTDAGEKLELAKGRRLWLFVSGPLRSFLPGSIGQERELPIHLATLCFARNQIEREPI